jgi:F-type H+-transporting ATPase subunit epsilon
VFAQHDEVLRIVAETRAGSFGLLPHRLDCAAALVPGIMIYETKEASMYLAVDEGVMIKSGADVLVSVRRAIAGTDLEDLHDAVKREFLILDQREREVRMALEKMEAGFIGRLAGFGRER